MHHWWPCGDGAPSVVMSVNGRFDRLRSLCLQSVTIGAAGAHGGIGVSNGVGGLDHWARPIARDNAVNADLQVAGQPRPRWSLASVLPAAVAGVIVGAFQVVTATSFAALVFAGDLGVHLPKAVGLGLFGAAIVMAVLASRGVLGTAQDVPAAILGVAAVSVSSSLPAAAPETFLTVTLLIAVSSVLVGACFLLLGTLHLGNLVRFVPYPVVGGFLGGTGVLLVEGSIGVMSGSSFSLVEIARLASDGSVVRWLPGVAFGVLLLVLVRRGVSFVAIPALFLAAVTAFYGIIFVGGASLADAQAGGWLLGPFPEGGLWRWWITDAVSSVDVSAIGSQASTITTLALLSALSLLLNATGIELVTGRDTDLDRELRAAGVANVVAGIGGGLPGYHALSFNALAQRMGVPAGPTGLISAGVCGLALLAGSSVLSLIPRAAIGGMLLFVGLVLAVEWIHDAWFRLPHAEYAILLVIVVAIAGWGFAAGVTVGLVAAAVLFLVNYSRIDVVKHALTGRTYQSNVDRSADDREYLIDCGERLLIIKLHGFLFFGTAHALLERIRSRIADPETPAVRFLVLDFSSVTGLDSSAALSFAKIHAMCASEQISVVFAALKESSRTVLDQVVIAEGDDADLRVFTDADRGVQWCEDRLLASRMTGAEGSDDARSAWKAISDTGGFTGATGFDSRLLAYMQRMDLHPGDTLIRQGDDAKDLYFLDSGRLTAHLESDDGGPSVRLRTLKAGTVVGELTLYLGTARSATVIADSPSRVYRLPYVALQALEREEPKLAAALHRWLAGLMARRIVDSNRTIAALLD